MSTSIYFPLPSGQQIGEPTFQGLQVAIVGLQVVPWRGQTVHVSYFSPLFGHFLKYRRGASTVYGWVNQQQPATRVKPVKWQLTDTRNAIWPFTFTHPGATRAASRGAPPAAAQPPLPLSFTATVWRDCWHDCISLIVVDCCEFLPTSNLASVH